MGDIYRATDSVLDREVAIKLLSDRFARDAELRERFTREALAAARLSGEPHIVTIFDVGDWDGRPYIVMEYLPGGSLEQRLRAGVPDTSDALRWLEEAARGLDFGHRRGIVHRDVKPGNLLLDRDERVRVADFGIATATGQSALTMTGTILGTAGYLAPEQASGLRATPASDRYGLAVVAWELLAGERPFAADSPTAEAAAHVSAAVPSLCERRPDLPCRELDEVFRRGLAKDPQARYGSCAELVAELKDALASGAQPTVPLRPATPPARRRATSWRWGALAALLVVTLGAGAALAAALAGGNGSAQPTTRVSRVTVTAPGTTQTVTTPVTTAPQAGGGSVAEGVRLTDEAKALLDAGEYEEAAATAQAALQHLGGTGELYEAYALYNLGAALIGLGDCKQGLKHIRRSERIQGPRSEFDEARAQCRGGGGADGDED
jgi:eukaryotic-like serine/threonine-protein kinase